MAKSAAAKKEVPVVVVSDASAFCDVASTLRGEYTLLGVRVFGPDLLVHRWTQKAVIEMLAKMSGHPAPQMNKDLHEEGLNSAYRNVDEVDVLPCRILKACFKNGASRTRGAVKQGEFSQHVRVLGHTLGLQRRAEMGSAMAGKVSCAVHRRAAMWQGS